MMEIYVTEENIRDLIIYRLFYNKRTGKVDKVPEWLFAGKPYRELEAALLKFFKGGNKAGVWYTRQEAKNFLARSRNASILIKIGLFRGYLVKHILFLNGNCSNLSNNSVLSVDR